MNQKGSVTPVHYMCNLIFILFQAISLILQAWCMLSVVILKDKSVHSHKSSCKHVYMMYVSSKHVLSELPIGHRWLTWGDRLCLSSSWCSPRPSPADPLGRNICPVPAWWASLGVARCVEPPIPLALSAQEGFSSNRSHRLSVLWEEESQVCCLCCTFFCLCGPHPGEALLRRGREMDLAGRTLLWGYCWSQTQSCHVQQFFLTHVLQPLMQSRVKHYVLIKRLMAMILTAKLLYAQTLCAM